MMLNAEPVLWASQWVNSSDLQRQAEKVSSYLTDPAFRIAVFAPFNHGKSTLLNALLGGHALPIDLVPTTGTAIVIKYGTEFKTCIRTVDGQEICAAGTDLLQKFTRLDDNRSMRADVTAVEVSYPHPLLARGVELIDLPGTDDMEAQDNLVYQSLLTADLVIQVLDARKLFTLSEVSKLQDWLLHRGIQTSIFVLNFMNLLEPDEHQAVLSRARSIAGEFRGMLPDQISNLYRVDALPALRARIQGNQPLASESGIEPFAATLAQTTDTLSSEKVKLRLPRIQAIARQIRDDLKVQSETLEQAITRYEADRNQQLQRLQEDVDQMRTSFETKIMALENWCSLSNLLSQYRIVAAAALQSDSFQSWKNERFKQNLTSYQNAVIKQVNQACERFSQPRPTPLSIALPADPSIAKPTPPSTSEPTKQSIAIATGVGWLLAGPIGGAVVAGITHAVNENTKKNNTVSWENYRAELSNVCSQGASDYFSHFSSTALNQIKNFAKSCQGIFRLPVLPEPFEITNTRDQKDKILEAISDLEAWLRLAEMYES